jgi:hypothetical protein
MDAEGVEVIAAYPAILSDREVPESWELVAHWEMAGERITGPYSRFLFWAERGAPSDRLLRNLEEFDRELPDHVETVCVRCLVELAEAQEPSS